MNSETKRPDVWSTEVRGESLDQERALYGLKNLHVVDCAFTGAADGESAVKECGNVLVERTRCNLRYPFWHTRRLEVEDCDITENGRAALWYASDVHVRNSRLHGIKAFRECDRVRVDHCDVVSNEFGWFCRDFSMRECTVASDYFMLHSSDVRMENVRFKGKYALQYLTNCVFENCDITSRDAFWHARDVVVRNCDLKGEFLGWYSQNLVLDHCRILSSQALCYCRNLTLVDCKVVDSDLCFEKSDVNATIVNVVESIKNPRSGRIVLPGVEETVMDDPSSTCILEITGTDGAVSGKKNTAGIGRPHALDACVNS